MFGTKKLKQRIAFLESVLDEQDKELSQMAHFGSTYTLTESDLVKHKQWTARKKDAVQRMACSIGYRILKRFPPSDIIENGVVVGYHVEIDVRRADSGAEE